MSIPLIARRIDLANLVIAKGSNFILTVLLFALISRDMDARAFGEFGYWWSIAIMIGGILLGGFSSALVRAVAMHGSLQHLLGPLLWATCSLLALCCVIGTVYLWLPQHSALIMLLAFLGFFGILVQVQAAILALLRAAEATRAHIVACVIIVVLIPSWLYLYIGDALSLVQVFGLLAVAFAFSTFCVLLIASRTLGYLSGSTAAGKEQASSVSEFFFNTFSFTVINIFTYSAINVDFTLFRLIGTAAEFEMMATAKIFFERFLMPILMVFAGAISLRVLRYQGPVDGAILQIRMLGGFIMWLCTSAIVMLLLTMAYWVFVYFFRNEPNTIPLGWVVCACAGYLLYAVNGILLDVLVVRRSLTAVITHVAGFLTFGFAVQAFAISSFGLPGWAVGWLVFNLFVGGFLAREGLGVGPRAGL